MATEAQIKASAKWKAKNRERNRINNYRSTARNFIKKHSSLKDLEEFKKLIAEREKELKED